jgi:tetratricopeptide (TPR) repeat protein
LERPDAAVELRITRQSLFHAGHADQNDADTCAVEYVADEFGCRPWIEECFHARKRPAFESLGGNRGSQEPGCRRCDLWGFEDRAWALSSGRHGARTSFYGLAYYDKKSHDQAIADYTKAIELDPDAISYFRRGLAYTTRSPMTKQ